MINYLIKGDLRVEKEVELGLYKDIVENYYNGSNDIIEEDLIVYKTRMVNLEELLKATY